MKSVAAPWLILMSFLWAFAWPMCDVHADSPSAQPAIQPAQASLFDPARHMHVSEVKPGMTGYGLTVFKGTKIEKFNVEVVSVLKNFNPKYDVVLIRCKDAFLQHTGSIAGMSGSPIYLHDENGHDRMIGAFAYGWPLTKDPIAGVQPIEYMLALPSAPQNPDNTGRPPRPAQANAESQAGERGTWSLWDAGVLPMEWKENRHSWADLLQPPLKQNDLTGVPRLTPLATPLMISGLSPTAMSQLSPAFNAVGLVPLQAGVGGSGTIDGPAAPMEPGSVFAVPLLTGDVELTAIGTTTEVIGNRVWGFGHPFNNEGRVSLPMGSGQVNGIIPNIQTSFKLGSLTQMRGTLTTDASVGVSGHEGGLPPMVPIELTVSPADGSEPRVYHFQAAQHPRFTPLIAGAAFSGALVGSSELPQYNTVDYDLDLTFVNGKTVHLANRSANATAVDVFGDAIAVMSAASDNPFERVLLKNVSGWVKVSPRVEEAQILDVHLPKTRYRPGETIKAYVTYLPFRSTQQTMPVELDLPRDLGPGMYELVISDAQHYFMQEQQTEPFRLTAQNINDVFAVLNDVTKVRENALYLRLLRQPDGIAIGRTAMLRLPSSRRQILMGAGRSDTTLFVSSTVKTVPTEMVMNGSAEFAITIEAGAKVAVAGVVAPTVAPAVIPGKAEEQHRVETPIPKGPQTPAPKKPEPGGGEH